MKGRFLMERKIEIMSVGHGEEYNITEKYRVDSLDDHDWPEVGQRVYGEWFVMCPTTSTDALLDGELAIMVTARKKALKEKTLTEVYKKAMSQIHGHISFLGQHLKPGNHSILDLGDEKIAIRKTEDGMVAYRIEPKDE